MRTHYGDFVEIPIGVFSMGNNQPYQSLNGEIRKEHAHARLVHEVAITKRLAFMDAPLRCDRLAIFLGRHAGVLTDSSFKFKVFEDPEKAYALGDEIEHPPTRTWQQSTHRYWLDPANETLPATGLSWDDALAFCEAISLELGLRVRLPTEAEWEYACRAGTSSVFHFGNDTRMVADHAWCCVNSGLEPKAAKKFPPNAWGLYDMAGNVWEWCQDKYSTSYYSRSPGRDPLCVDQDVEARVIRGGSSMNKAETCRSSHRFGLKPTFRDRFLGVRPVIELT